MPALLAIDHLTGPTAFDVLAWAGLALIVVRIGRTGDTRWWLAGGLVLGLGLAHRYSVGFFAIALLIGALLSGGRHLVLNRWLLAGAAIAAAFTVSGHNSFWWWGPGNPRASTVVAVTPGPVDGTGYAAYLRQFFTSVRLAATLSNPYGIQDQEWGGHVYVCTGPRHPWAQMWPRVRSYG